MNPTGANSASRASRAERDVEQREQHEDDEVVRVHERGQSERGAERDAEPDLRRRALGVQGFDERLEEFEKDEHGGGRVGRGRAGRGQRVPAEG